MKSLYAALTALFFLFTNIASADDILIPFGGTTATPPAWKYRGGNTDLNGQLWKNLTYSETGWATGGSALGFGAGPAENTVILQDGSANSGADVPGSPYPTMYFRKTINIPSLAGYTNFQLRTQFDDAIVIWINGTEAYRSNIVANPTFATYADGTNTTYNNGVAVFTATLANSLFVAGDNIIAVEIHQNNNASSDLFFDLELTGISAPPTGDVVIFPFGLNNNASATAWKYKGGSTNLNGEPWKGLTYSEPGWVTGNSALGFGANPPVRSTAIPEDASAGGGGVAGGRYPTLYFRKVVNIADPSIYAAFKISTRFDDGIVVWVNGVQAYINNINANPLYEDWAPAAIANNGADIYNTTVATSMFTTGDNIIAVEIHQTSAGSSDLFFDMELTGLATLSGTLTRGPYLQVGNQTGVTIRWRTDIATNSRVTWGTAFGTYPNTVDDAALTTEHIVRVNGLLADTKYFYTIGSTTQTLQATNTNYVLTAPLANSTRKLRFSAIGDCGNTSTNQVDTKNALLSYIGTNDIDATILLGDNAYSSGTDAEYQLEFFDIYKNDLLRNKKLYPAPGNHDYGNSAANTGNTGSTTALSMPYHKNFSVPTAAECGGIASGSKSYYSFDIGDVHFLSLDSYGKENANTTKLYDTAGAQAIWVKNDLAANTKRWTVVYFHHPPYTKTSHDSDTELADLGTMRENFIRILERYGVDLVLCGHSHGYERSYLLKNYYKTNPGDPTLLEPAFNIASHTALGNNQNAKYDGTANSCAYTYNSGQYNHGSMYVVAGSAGQIGGASAGYPHNAMYYSNNTQGGSLYFEVDSNRLDAKFISYTGTGAGVTPLVLDQFTIFKDVNRVYNLNVNQNTSLNLAASWRGNYVWPDNGNATTQAVTLTNTVAGSFTYRVRDAASANCLQDVFNVTVNGTLPVSLLSFDAKLNNDKVLLNWATAQEQDNRHFTIEKSTNGTAFNFFSKVDGLVNSNTVKDYSVTDFTPALGDNYYRLSQTNTNNKITYLQTRKVTYKGNQKFYASIYNANENTSMIINSSKNDKVSMRVIDMLGKEVMQENFTVNAGANTKNLSLQKGIYVLVLTNSNGDTINSKIIIQ
jgi:predicted MPP superfamily phosphohydrolase